MQSEKHRHGCFLCYNRAACHRRCGAAIYFGVRPKREYGSDRIYGRVRSVKNEIAGYVMPKETFISENGEHIWALSLTLCG
jgi:hypothetical protein